MIWLVGSEGPISSRELAQLQNIPSAFVAKIFPQLEKAGLVRSTPGIHGGYVLARAADEISVLDVLDAVEGRKPIFECQEIRSRCALFGDTAPSWSTQGLCAVHDVMLRAEQSMRTELGRRTLADVTRTFKSKAPAGFSEDVRSWFANRVDQRSKAREEGVRAARAERDREA